jgi:hypothetical protein
MKLLSISNKHEGDSYPKAHLSFGRLIQSNKLFNGFYVCFRSPFTKHQEFTSVVNFEVYTGPCRMTYLLMVRRPRNVEPYICVKQAIWVPEEWP